MGLSYTGLAASYVALESGGLLYLVISQSGSYWSDDCWLSKRIEERSTPVDISFYLDVGDEETETNVQHREDVRHRLEHPRELESLDGRWEDERGDVQGKVAEVVTGLHLK